MQQIANWLESLGLGEYTQRFAENRIDASVLCDLTDRDLEKSGSRWATVIPAIPPHTKTMPSARCGAFVPNGVGGREKFEEGRRSRC
jgi:hypothetical protein